MTRKKKRQGEKLKKLKKHDDDATINEVSVSEEISDIVAPSWIIRTGCKVKSFSFGTYERKTSHVQVSYCSLT